MFLLNCHIWIWISSLLQLWHHAMYFLWACVVSCARDIFRAHKLSRVRDATSVILWWMFVCFVDDSCFFQQTALCCVCWCLFSLVLIILVWYFSKHSNKGSRCWCSGFTVSCLISLIRNTCELQGQDIDLVNSTQSECKFIDFKWIKSKSSSESVFVTQILARIIRIWSMNLTIRSCVAPWQVNYIRPTLAIH